mgnify:CR=1 FL=1
MTDLPKPSGPEPEQPEPKLGSGSSEANNGQTIEPVALLHLWQIQPIRDLLWLALIVIAIWVGYEMRAVTVPLLVALLLAYLFEPLIRWAAATAWIPLNRIAAITVLLVVSMIVFIAAMILVIPLLLGQTLAFVGAVESGTIHDRLSRLVKEYAPTALEPELQDVVDYLPIKRPDDTSDAQGAAVSSGDASAMSSSAQEDDSSSSDSKKAGAEKDTGKQAPPKEQQADASTGVTTDGTLVAGLNRKQLDALIDLRIDESQAAASITSQAASQGPWAWVTWAQSTGEALGSVLRVIIWIAFLLVLIPFYFFFFSMWYPSVTRFFTDLLPVSRRSRIMDLVHKMDRAVASFVRIRLIIALIIGILLAIGWMMCGVPYAILLGLAIGLIWVVPYLGIIGLPISIALLFVDQVGLDEAQRMVWWQIVLWPSVVWCIVATLEAWILTPWLGSRATKLDPVTIFVAVLAGGSVLGIYGMLLAIPVAACLKIIIIDVFLPRVRAWARGDLTDPLPLEHPLDRGKKV